MCVSLPPSLASDIGLAIFFCFVLFFMWGGGGRGGLSMHHLPRIPIGLYCHMARRSIVKEQLRQYSLVFPPASYFVSPLMITYALSQYKMLSYQPL